MATRRGAQFSDACAVSRLGDLGGPPLAAPALFGSPFALDGVCRGLFGA